MTMSMSRIFEVPEYEERWENVSSLAQLLTMAILTDHFEMKPRQFLDLAENLDKHIKAHSELPTA